MKVTQSVAEQVEATLTAAMVEEACAQAVRSGLLVGALSATGVDEVDVAAAVALPEALGFTATPARPHRRARRAASRTGPGGRGDGPGRRPRRRDAAEQEVEGARAAHEEAATRPAGSRRGACSCRPRWRSCGQDRRPRAAAEELDDELDDADDIRDEAESALSAAERARDRARAALDRLG